MLVRTNSGILVGRKQQMLDQVQPSVQEYGSAPVYRERTFIAKPTGWLRRARAELLRGQALLLGHGRVGPGRPDSARGRCCTRSCRPPRRV